MKRSKRFSVPRVLVWKFSSFCVTDSFLSSVFSSSDGWNEGPQVVGHASKGERGLLHEDAWRGHHHDCEFHHHGAAFPIRARSVIRSACACFSIFHRSLSLSRSAGIYLRPTSNHELSVDIGRGETLLIEVDYTFPYIPCAWLSLDNMDVSGDLHLDVVSAGDSSSCDISP
jgi:hypothetical protein